MLCPSDDWGCRVTVTLPCTTHHRSHAFLLAGSGPGAIHAQCGRSSLNTHWAFTADKSQSQANRSIMHHTGSHHLSLALCHTSGLSGLCTTFGLGHAGLMDSLSDTLKHHSAIGSGPCSGTVHASMPFGQVTRTMLLLTLSIGCSPAAEAGEHNPLARPGATWPASHRSGVAAAMG